MKVMQFLWYEPKRQANLKKHGPNSVYAGHFFNGPLLTFENDRNNHGEPRWIALGLLGMRVTVMVITQAEKEDEICVFPKHEADQR